MVRPPPALPATNVVGVDVGGTSIKAARYDCSGEPEASVDVPTSVTGRRVVGLIVDLVRHLRTPQTLALGVAVPGTVDVAHGAVGYAANLQWRDLQLRELLAGPLQLPVAIDHDVRAAAVAESRHVMGDFVFVSLGTGVSCADVQSGSVWPGGSGRAGEIGHVPVYPCGEPCSCGQRGCLEAYASAAAISRRYLAAGGTRQRSSREIARRLGNDRTADRVWAQAATALALALTSDILVFDPATIVLGGGLGEAGDLLIAPVRAEVAARLDWRSPPKIVRSALGPVAARNGAAILAQRLARASIRSNPPVSDPVG